MALPGSFVLDQNYPNPFNPTTAIAFSLPQKSMVSLIVYNTLGQIVATLWRGDLGPGRHEFSLDGSRLASGAYLYRLEAGNFSGTKKCVLIR